MQLYEHMFADVKVLSAIASWPANADRTRRNEPNGPVRRGFAVGTSQKPQKRKVCDMRSTLFREMPVDHNTTSPRHDTRLVELVMALSGCPARTALDLVQTEPAASPLTRVAYALAAMRAEGRRSFAG